MKLDRKKFENWLQSKQPFEIVGKNRDCHGCPIALYYQEAAGNEIVISDNGGEYTIDRGDGARRLPRWAADFVFEVDGYAQTKITAQDALMILRVHR